MYFIFISTEKQCIAKDLLLQHFFIGFLASKGMIITSIPLSQGRSMVGTFLAQKVSSDVTGTYLPPFYQLSGVAVAEVCDYMT